MVTQLLFIVTLLSSNQAAAIPLRNPPTTSHFLWSVVHLFTIDALTNASNYSIGCLASVPLKSFTLAVAFSPTLACNAFGFASLASNIPSKTTQIWSVVAAIIAKLGTLICGKEFGKLTGELVTVGILFMF